jgi:hypothetical protein
MMLAALLVVAVVAGGVGADCGAKRVEHTETFLSEGIKIRPGDENGDPVPLSDVYLHHWIMFEFTIPEGGAALAGEKLQEAMRGSGAHAYHVGQPAAGLGRPPVHQAWAKGGETRHLNSTIPAPYGMVSGGKGLRTQWMLNVHGIDTRGARDRMGCTECRYA